MKSDKIVLGLKEFLIRREVLKVYKDIIKYVNRIDDATYRVELTKWARHDFRMNKKLTDQGHIKAELARAKLSLNELATSMNMAK